MKKIKNWFIHKLGGLTKDEANFYERMYLEPETVIKICNNPKIKRLRSEVVSDYEYPLYLYKTITNNLKDGICKEVDKQHFNLKKEKRNNKFVYYIELEFLEQEV